MFRDAEKLWQSHRDKEWDLTDCYSFCVLRSESIRFGLAFQDQFRQAGFEIVK